MNNDDIVYISSIKSRIDNANSNLIKERIMGEAVEKLLRSGLSYEEILNLFSIDLILEHQMNSSMIDNNERYLLLLKKVLEAKK